MGIPGSNDFSDNVLTYIDVLKHNKPVGERVAVIGAGGIGFDVSEFLLYGKERDEIEEDLGVLEGNDRSEPRTPRRPSKGRTDLAARSTETDCLPDAAQKGQGGCRPRTNDRLDPSSEPTKFQESDNDIRCQILRQDRFKRKSRV